VKILEKAIPPMGFPRCKQSTVSYMGKGSKDVVRTHQVLTMRVHLATEIIRIQVDELLVDEPIKDCIIRSLPVLDTREGASRDKPGTIPGFGTPSHHLAFLITNGRIRNGGSPKAEI